MICHTTRSNKPHYSLFLSFVSWTSWTLSFVSLSPFARTLTDSDGLEFGFGKMRRDGRTYPYECDSPTDSDGVYKISPSFFFFVSRSLFSMMYTRHCRNHRQKCLNQSLRSFIHSFSRVLAGGMVGGRSLRGIDLQYCSRVLAHDLRGEVDKICVAMRRFTIVTYLCAVRVVHYAGERNSWQLAMPSGGRSS